MSEFSDDKLIAEFIAESREYLNAIEPDLLCLEQNECLADPDAINCIFLEIHSVKGASDPLTHLVRNGCVHGMELSEERVLNGKPRTGNIVLRAFHQDEQINISISDDGHGIDTNKLIQKALLKGLLPEAELQVLSPQEQANLIFLPGLSTAEQISDISGRGVGMDVIKTKITRMGGFK